MQQRSAVNLTDFIPAINNAQVLNHESSISEWGCPKVVLADLTHRDDQDRQNRKRGHFKLVHKVVVANVDTSYFCSRIS